MPKFRKGQKVVVYPKTGLERVGKISSTKKVGRITEYSIREQGRMKHFYGFELKALPKKPRRRHRKK